MKDKVGWRTGGDYQKLERKKPLSSVFEVLILGSYICMAA